MMWRGDSDGVRGGGDGVRGGVGDNVQRREGHSLVPSQRLFQL